jgi:MFS family permease
MSFLELLPHYECSKNQGFTWYPCKNTEFCGVKGVQWRVDYSFQDSLHNWVETLDLNCTPKSQIGLLGSMLFAGWAVSATFLPRLADVYGRRRVYLVSMVAHAFFYGLIIISHDLKFSTAMQFFLGMASVGRASVGYLYSLELVPHAQQTAVGTML